MLELKSSITKQQKSVFTGFLSRCMQYGLKNQWSRHLFKHMRIDSPYLHAHRQYFKFSVLE